MEPGKDTPITQAITSAAGVAASTDLNGTALDMANHEAVLAIVNMGVITSGAVTGFKWQQDDVVGMGGASDLAGSAQVIADTDDEKTVYGALIKPTKRFVRLVITRATQNAVVGGAHYVQFGPKKSPVTHGSNVSGETHVSPAEGTA